MKTKNYIFNIGLALSYYYTNAQTNDFPLTGNAEIKTGKLLIETNTWRESLLTFRDIHYSPAQVYNFQIESDGLKIKQDNLVYYQFLSGGNFSVNQGKLGIGTNVPESKVHIVTNNWMPSLLTLEDKHYSGQVYNFQIESDGLKIKQENTVNYQFLTGGNFIVNNGNIGIGTTNPSAKLDVNGTVKIGSVNTPAGYKLFVEEGILSEKVKVAVKNSADWADHVFDGNYKLSKLEEVEQFIAANKHLPNIPSAAEVVKEGIDLGKMDARLLEKVEELTLYLIEQHTKNSEQEKRLNYLEEQNKAWEAKNKALEQKLNALEHSQQE